MSVFGKIMSGIFGHAAATPASGGAAPGATVPGGAAASTPITKRPSNSEV